MCEARARASRSTRFSARSAPTTDSTSRKWRRSAAFARSPARARSPCRSEEHTSELQSLMRISYAVFCLKKKNNQLNTNYNYKLDIQQQMKLQRIKTRTV